MRAQSIFPALRLRHQTRVPEPKLSCAESLFFAAADRVREEAEWRQVSSSTPRCSHSCSWLLHSSFWRTWATGPLAALCEFGKHRSSREWTRTQGTCTTRRRSSRLLPVLDDQGEHGSLPTAVTLSSSLAVSTRFCHRRGPGDPNQLLQSHSHGYECTDSLALPAATRKPTLRLNGLHDS